jgi:hypothetical protein
MKVLLVGEGAHELSGALEQLVQRVSAKPLDCTRARVQDNSIHAHHGKGRGYFKKTVRWILEARERGFDALVLVIDQDSRTERNEELRQAQEENSVTRGIARAVGVAIRTFDAWMLADELAAGQVLACNVSPQQAPETIGMPKEVCRGLLTASGREIGLSQMYAEIAAVARIDLLEQRCPRGFGTFALRVRAL